MEFLKIVESRGGYKFLLTFVYVSKSLKKNAGSTLKVKSATESKLPAY